MSPSHRPNGNVEGLSRLLLAPFLHRMAMVHQSSFPARPVVERYTADSSALVNAIHFEGVVTQLFGAMEQWSQPDAPIEVVTSPAGDMTSIVMVEHHPLDVERDLALWGMSANGNGARPRAAHHEGLKRCREIIEAMGGEIWSAPRHGGSALVLNVPRVSSRGRLLRIAPWLRRRRHLRAAA
jgi:hypothetical protein